MPLAFIQYKKEVEILDCPFLVSSWGAHEVVIFLCDLTYFDCGISPHGVGLAFSYFMWCSLVFYSLMSC